MIYELGDRIRRPDEKTVYMIVALEKTTIGKLVKYFGWVIKENMMGSTEKWLLMDIMDDDEISVYVVLL